MVRLAYVVTGDASVAEDLAQEAFVRVAGRFGHLRNRDAFGAYLRRALLNLCKNHFRRRDTERKFLSTESEPGSTHPQEAADTTYAVRSALLSLPVRQRAALALRYFEDLSIEETARALGCRPGTVKSLTSRAFHSLRVRLSEEEVDPA
jgi:RNA polymerase sigma-70 factor (sigma-E family)